MFWHVLCSASKYLIFLLITELAAITQPKNLLHWPKTTRNTWKIANKLMTVASAEINLQSKQDFICHLVKVKAATSAFHGWRNTFLFLAYLLFPFESNTSIRPKENIFYQSKENNIRNIVFVLMFQQLLASKHHRLRHSKFGRVKVWVWSPTKLKKNKKIC